MREATNPGLTAALLTAGLLTASRPCVTQEAAFPRLPAEAPAGTGLLRPCEFPDLLGTARCGMFRVYEDRAARSGRTIDIAFVVLEALRPAERLEDAILLLPGGPGEAFIDGTARRSRTLSYLRGRRDVVLADVRGVGRSSSLSCTVPYPGGFESRFGTVFPLDHARACRNDLSKRARLDLYTTAASVDDLEDLRRWLGPPRWNLIGASYGTRVAQVYLRRHPEAVRTVVLNGVAPISVPVYVRHAALLQRALDLLVDECRDDAACHAEHPEFGTRVDAVLARLRRGPVEVEVDGRRLAFSAGDLSYALRGLLYGRAAELPGLIDRASGGDFAPLAEYYVQRTGWIGEPGGEAGYHFSVLCAEDIAPLTDEAVARATAGTFMGDHLIRSYRAVCDLWPHARLPSSHWERVESPVPTLLLSGERDPVTPPEGAESVAAGLPNHVHVVIPNGGHGVGGPCIRTLIARLIETGSTRELDPSCGVETPARERP